MPQNEIIRIRAGDFTESEAARLENARRVLEEGGFENEINTVAGKKVMDVSKLETQKFLSDY